MLLKMEVMFCCIDRHIYNAVSTLKELSSYYYDKYVITIISNTTVIDIAK